MGSPLSGIRVIELCEVWAGPMAASFLADLGADVIKVESYPRNSMTRSLVEGPTVGVGEGPPYERAANHHISNRNKRNIAVNLRTEEGAEILRRLLGRSDVLLDGYSAGTIERLGFGWETVHSLNPLLSMISLPGWGVAGPYRGYVTLGAGLDAAAGHLALRGYPDRPLESVGPVYHSDATGALTAAFAAVAALRRRELAGEGCFVDLSQLEAMHWHLAGQLAEWTFNGRLPQRQGNRDAHIVPHCCYRAGGGEAGADDAWVVIAAENDAQWAALAGVMGHPEWAVDGHPWATVTGRLAVRDAIDEAIAAFATTDTAEAIAERVQGAGAIAAPAIAPWSVLSSPQHLARGWLQFVTHPNVGQHVRLGFAWRSEPDPPVLEHQCGLVGEHNREVFAELGYTGEVVAELEAAGVIGDRYEMPG